MIFYKETDFKETMIGKIPNDWTIAKLSNQIDTETGKRAKGGALNEGNVASIGGEHIDGRGNIQWSDMKFIPEDFYNSLKQGKVNLGDILLVKDGATTGKVAIVKSLKYKKVAVNEHVFIIRSKTHQLANDFLFYFLFSKFGQVQIRTRFHGLIGGIIRDDLETIWISLPSSSEQRKIAEVLSTVDQAIQKVDEVIVRTERLKKGLMQELLTKGIGHKEFIYSKELGFEISKEWKVEKLGNVAEFKNGINFAKEQKGDKGVLTVDVLNMYGESIYLDFANLYRVNISLEDVSEYLLKKGDILFVRSSLKREGVGWASLFNGYDEPITFCGFIIKARLKSKSILPEFLTYFLRSDIARSKLIAGSGQVAITNVTQELLKILRIPLASIEEQQKITKILSTVDKKLEIERNEKSKLERTKQGLMDLLLTGKVRIKVS